MKLIKDATSLFSYIDSDFKNWNVDEGVEQENRVVLKTQKAEKDFKFSDVFKESDAISQEDMLTWVEQNKEEILKTGHYYMFVLRNSKGESFVAIVFEFGGQLVVDVDGFSHTDVWGASDGSVFIFPQRSETLSTNEADSLPLGVFESLVARVEKLEQWQQAMKEAIVKE